VEGLAKADKVLDVRGFSCPWCILKAKSELNIMQPGQVLEVLVTDPMMLVDFPNVLGKSGHQLIHINEQPDFSRIYVRRGDEERSSGICGS
jgi:tRNA 2-thiouridine synthesizing protein A